MLPTRLAGMGSALGPFPTCVKALEKGHLPQPPPSRSSGGSNFRGGSIATGSIGALIEKVRFAADSPLEGDGFELPVPGALGEAERARRGKITDPLFSFVSLPYGYPATSCVGINPKNLNRPPKR